MRALNIEVPRDLLMRWIQWFAPDVQPFLVDADLADCLGMEPEGTPLPAELRDTFAIYGLPNRLGYVWLNESHFMGLPKAVRAALVRAQRTFERQLVPSVKAWPSLDGVRGQADGHRFVW